MIPHIMIIGALQSHSDYSFLQKRGYSEIYPNAVCHEMKLELNYPLKERNIDGVVFEYYRGEIRDLLKAVDSVDQTWTQYFNEHSNTFVCLKNGEIVSFCQIDYNSECLLSHKKKIGSIGCVGTVIQHRNKGYGLAMIERAINELIYHDCEQSFIHYTHMAKWYEKLGYETFAYFWFCKKNI